MLEETTETVNEASTPSPADDTSSSQVQEEATQVDHPEEQNQEQEGAAQPTEQGERRQTRSERRIQQLLEKVKEKPRAEVPFFEETPLIRPEEYETGIDPQELARREAIRQQQLGYKLKSQIKTEFAYERAMDDHRADLEAVSSNPDIKKNPALERMAVRLYERENYQVDPRTGQTFFNPVLKLSEALEIVKHDLTEATGNALADVQVRANENRETSALAPSQDGGSNHDAEYQEAYSRAVKTGSDENWAEVLKKRGLVKLS